MTHTPGPWIAMPHKDNSRRFQVRGPDPDGCGSSPISYFVCENAKRDNAILIAAAPELLAALRRVVIPLERLGDFIGNTDTGGASGLGKFDRCEILLAVRNAIATAEGRTA
jgi:hypothetical protein